MKRRSFLKLAGAFFLSALIPGGKWLEASAATEAVATTTRVGLPSHALDTLVYQQAAFRAEHLNAGLYRMVLPARVVRGGSSITFEAGEVKGEINFHDAPELVTREALSILSKNIEAGAPALARSYAVTGGKIVKWGKK